MPSFAVKGGVPYRHYVSRAIVEGQRRVAGSIVRVPAAAVEHVVSQAISGFGEIETEAQAVSERVERVTIQPTVLRYC